MELLLKMNINDLTISPEIPQFELLLDAWSWLIPSGSRSVLLTALGDAFIQEPDGKVHHLDASRWHLEKVAESGEEFSALLQNSEFVHNFFYPQMIAQCRNQGMTLSTGEIYSYKQV